MTAKLVYSGIFLTMFQALVIPRVCGMPGIVHECHMPLVFFISMGLILRGKILLDVVSHPALFSAGYQGMTWDAIVATYFLRWLCCGCSLVIPGSEALRNLFDLLCHAGALWHVVLGAAITKACLLALIQNRCHRWFGLGTKLCQ